MVSSNTKDIESSMRGAFGLQPSLSTMRIVSWPGNGVWPTAKVWAVADIWWLPLSPSRWGLQSSPQSWFFSWVFKEETRSFAM